MTVASQVKQTLATLKSSESILKIYSNQSQVKGTVEIYKEILEGTTGIINDLDNRLKILEQQESKYKGN